MERVAREGRWGLSLPYKTVVGKTKRKATEAYIG
jgi:hypothetical protein